MMLRLMCATALMLALGAGALAMWPEPPPGERVASRAEFLAAHPRAMPASLAACAPVAAPVGHTQI